MSLKKAKELRAERAAIHEQAQALLNKAEGENRDFNADEQKQWDKMQDDIKSLGNRAQRLEQEETERRATSGLPIGALESQLDVELLPQARQFIEFDRFVRNQDDGPRGRATREFMLPAPAFVLPSDIPEEVRKQILEHRAQSTTTTAGGYLVPQGFSNALERAMLQFGGMRQSRATLIRTATGNQIEWPTVDDTSNEGALLSENTQDSEQDVTFGQKVLDAYKYTSKIVRVSVELMQDSFFDMGAFLGAALGERLGRIQNRHATVGTGSSQPNGIVVASTAGKTVASSSAVTHDELLDLKHSVDPAYRGQAQWMFNDATLLVLKKLKDSQNRPLWLPGIAVREPDTLDGQGYVVNQNMASMEASAKSILYGDFSKYVMREVLGITLVRMVERYADYHQVGFVAIMRFDGELIDAGTHPVKHILHPSP